MAKVRLAKQHWEFYKESMFKDPIAPKKKENGFKEWSFKAPTKDVSHSGEISCGNYYGVGHKSPIGKEQPKGLESGPIPQESRCFSPKEIFYGEDKRG